MSFGGAVASMVTSLKNNARERTSSYFDSFKKTRKPDANLENLLKKKASPEQLEAIRMRMAAERKTRTIKVVIYTIVFSLISYVIIHWVWYDALYKILD